jgi:hypothetical protein
MLHSRRRTMARRRGTKAQMRCACSDLVADVDARIAELSASPKRRDAVSVLSTPAAARGDEGLAVVERLPQPRRGGLRMRTSPAVSRTDGDGRSARLLGDDPAAVPTAESPGRG